LSTSLVVALVNFQKFILLSICVVLCDSDSAICGHVSVTALNVISVGFDRLQYG